MAERHKFYHDCCDFTFKCKNGDLELSKVMLSQQTPNFDFLLKDQASADVSEYDVETFVMFLDLLMGFEEITRENALLIFPIAHRYKVQDLIKKCVVKLTPGSLLSMDKSVIQSLNMAVGHDCEDLIDAIIDFLWNYGITRFFQQDVYYLLLEPKSVALLLRFVFKNPIILKSVVNWGRTYLRENELNDDLRTFLAKNRILSKLSLGILESHDSVLELYDPDPKKNAFTDSEFLTYLKGMTTLKEPEYDWVDAHVGLSRIEMFNLKLPFVVNKNTSFYVFFNPTVCDNYTGDDSCDHFFECTVAMKMKNVQGAEMLTAVEYKILPAEAMGSAKSKLLINFNGLQNTAYNQLYSICFIYKFHRNCKILRTVAELPPLEKAADHKKLYFTCCIKF